MSAAVTAPRTARELIAASGIPPREAEILLLKVLSKHRAWLYAHGDELVDSTLAEQFLAWVGRHAAGEPLAYILGQREFWSLPLRVTPAVLIPRPDTELLVQWALELIHANGWSRCVDMGTGSGAIALALKSEATALAVTAVDASADALAVARANGEQLGLTVEWREGNWFDGLPDGRWPLVVSNPPYIADGDPHLTQGDLPAEPLSALVSGPDGLDDIREIIAAAPGRLESGGWLLLEHGWDQGPAVRALLAEAGFIAVETRQDIGGNDRVTGGAIEHG